MLFKKRPSITALNATIGQVCTKTVCKRFPTVLRCVLRKILWCHCFLRTRPLSWLTWPRPSHYSLFLLRGWIGCTYWVKWNLPNTNVESAPKLLLISKRIDLVDYGSFKPVLKLFPSNMSLFGNDHRRRRIPRIEIAFLRRDGQSPWWGGIW